MKTFITLSAFLLSLSLSAQFTYNNPTSTPSSGIESNGNQAIGVHSFSVGHNNVSSGDFSTTIGGGNVASAGYSFAAGQLSNATGVLSTAIGGYVMASGGFSTAMGYQTTASGVVSTAMGGGTSAIGDYSTAMGINTAAAGLYSIALNGDTQAEGDYSLAAGASSIAYGNASVAMGRNTTASGNASTAMGYRTKAIGNFSNAMGDWTYASGIAATAMGYNTTASGDYSTVMGYRTRASGEYSTAMGWKTEASTWNTLVIGQNNLLGRNPTDDGGPAFVIGNSGWDEPELYSDAFSVLYDGTTNIAGSVTATSFIGDGSQLTNLPNDNTDDQAISFDTTTNIVSLEDGGTIDLSGLNNSGTDDQQLANFILSQGSLLSLSIQDGNVVSVDLAPILADLEEENAQQQSQIDQQQALIDDLIIRMEIREECACDPTLGIGDNTLQADKAYLLQNIPNPFDRTTSIGYFVPYTNAKAHIVISTMAGQIVHNIELSNLGVGAISIDSGRMAAAVYLYTLYVDGKRIDTKRMIVE